MNNFRILILEDDLKTLSALLDRLSKLEEQFYPKDFAVTVLSEYTQVEEYVNKKEDKDFDVILLDRDCKAGGSFHVLDFDKFDKNKIISISSTPPYNKEAKQRGIDKVVFKDFTDLKTFADRVIKQVEKLI